jgi:hypothetical protein
LEHSALVEVDACVVPTAPVAAMLREFVTGWLRERPSARGQRGLDANRDLAMGPFEVLEQRSGVPADEIRKIRNASAKTIELRVADALVAAVDRPEAFHTETRGRVRERGEDRTFPPLNELIRGNPLAPPERRALCCGGSTVPNRQ